MIATLAHFFSPEQLNSGTEENGVYKSAALGMGRFRTLRFAIDIVVKVAPECPIALIEISGVNDFLKERLRYKLIHLLRREMLQVSGVTRRGI